MALPKVKSEVFQGIRHTTDDEEYMVEALAIIKSENPVIHDHLVDVTNLLLEAGMDGRSLEAYLRGHLRMYMYLRAQDEANELAEQWGLDEPTKGEEK